MSEHNTRNSKSSEKSNQSFKPGSESDDRYENSTKPDFIYGGPFIKLEKPCPLLDTATPINLQLQGTFKKSFAYYSLKERLPVILTKVIDYLSREGSKIQTTFKATDQDIKNYIQYISKLKSDLITNKKYDLLTVDTPEAKRWNEWISNCENQQYFTNVWVFSECYVYRRLREGCEIYPSLIDFDPFAEQKAESFKSSLEPMCVVAEKLITMLPESEKDKRRADFISLLKICLWANKCDLSLSLGEQVTIKGRASKTSISVMDPFQMIIDLKDKLLVDDTGKIVDSVVTKAEAMAKAVESPPEASQSQAALKNPPPPAPAAAPAAAPAGEAPPAPKIPCPAKMSIPQAVMFDIVCDNAGYELFADLCLAHFLVAQNIVQKVRFHVKKIPWFVSDVTPRDFQYVIAQCKSASFTKTVPQEPKPPTGDEEGEPVAEEPPRVIGSADLHTLAEQWAKYVEDGIFIVLSDDFWTSPHVYKDMKKIDYNMYRKLQFAVAVVFKGDLNYRKLLGEKNCVNTQGFEASLQGFIPAPIIALRTVKSDLICGMPKGKYEQLNKIDEHWMRKGDYGVIQYCAKGEPLKAADKPCLDYGIRCFSKGCPIHGEL